MATETRVTDANQTQVPASLRSRFGVGPGDRVIWEEMADGTVRVRFRHKRRLSDLVGLADAGGDAVADKKRAQRGGR